MEFSDWVSLLAIFVAGLSYYNSSQSSDEKRSTEISNLKSEIYNELTSGEMNLIRSIQIDELSNLLYQLYPKAFGPEELQKFQESTKKLKDTQKKFKDFKKATADFNPTSSMSHQHLIELLNKDLRTVKQMSVLSENSLELTKCLEEYLNKITEIQRKMEAIEKEKFTDWSIPEYRKNWGVVCGPYTFPRDSY